MDDWVKLLSVSDAYQAELLAGRLRDAGVEPRLSPVANAPGAWLTGGDNPSRAVEVYVRGRQVEDAREVVAAFDAPAAEATDGRRRRPLVVVGTVAIALSIAAILISVLSEPLR